MKTKVHRTRGPRFLTSQLVRLVTESGAAGISTRDVAARLNRHPGKVQRMLLYCAECGRIRRLRPGTPGHTGNPATWAPISAEGGR